MNSEFGLFVVTDCDARTICAKRSKNLPLLQIFHYYFDLSLFKSVKETDILGLHEIKQGSESSVA